MLQIEVTHGQSEVEKFEGIDFVIHTRPSANVSAAGDVRTYCTDTRCEGMAPVFTSPRSLAENIHATLAPGVRAMVGNAGCELTFRHVFRKPSQNVQAMLQWAKQAYKIVGAQLILAPMDFDIIHDVMTGGKLLDWSARHGVPLVIFCGYRFLFPEHAFGHIRDVCARIPMSCSGNPYRFPYQEVSETIKRSGAQIWTGAGFTEGLQAGVLRKAEQFGMAGVLTSRNAWGQQSG